MTKGSQRYNSHTETKWVIEEDFPWVRTEQVILIPRVFDNDSDYYFVRTTEKAVSSSLVFSRPQDAANAVIKRNLQKIHDLNIDNDRLTEWRDKLDAAAPATLEGEKRR